MNCQCGKPAVTSLSIRISNANTGTLNEHTVDNLCSDCAYKISNVTRAIADLKKQGLQKREIVKLVFNMTVEEFEAKLNK